MSKQPSLHYFSRLTPDRVDKENGVVHGVSVITGGVQAKGHPLICDRTTVEEMFSACNGKGMVKTKANHKSGVKEVNGYLTNFRIGPCPTGEKLLADWHLMKKDPNYEHTLEIAERMPQTVGLSASFTSPKGKEKGETTKFGKAARVKEVLSVDFVTDPAANPDGLFEIGDSEVDKSGNDMAKTTDELLQEILTNQTNLASEVADIRQFNSDLLAEREAFEQEQSQLQEQEQEAEEVQTEGSEGEDGEENPLAAEFAALREEIRELQERNAELDQNEELDQYEQAFGLLHSQVTELAAQRDEALAELEQYRNPRVAASSDGVRLFSAGARNQSAFEQYVSEAKASGKKETVAIREFIAGHPDLYQEHLEAKTPVASISLSR